MDNSLGKVYSATYSGVDVYELIDSTGSIMRRKHDGWVNATHILKAASFPKAKRTRILEKDVQTRTHEKIQGGYGKYQGTWVPLETARELADEFGVHDRLTPLFELIRSYGASSPPPAPKHHHASKNVSLNEKPTKAKKSISMPNLGNSTIELGSFTESGPQKKRAKQKKTDTIVKKRALKAGNRDNEILESESDSANASQASMMQQDDQNTDQDDLAIRKELVFEDDNNGMGNINPQDGISSDMDGVFSLLETNNSSGDFLTEQEMADVMKTPKPNGKEKTMTETKEELISQLRHNVHNIIPMFGYDENGTMNQKSDDWYNSNKAYINRLLDYFFSVNDESETELPDFLKNPPKFIDIDQILDDDGNTIFIWTCSVGLALAADNFIKLSFGYRSANKKGETALMRAVHFVNAYKKRTFPRLLDLLHEHIFSFDSRHRTLLHHIASAAVSEELFPACRYYMEILLARIRDSQTSERLTTYLNSQDADGNTALHICAKNAHRKCIRLLLDYNAKPNLKNNAGKIASEVLLESSKAVHDRYEQHLKDQELKEKKILMKEDINYNVMEQPDNQAVIKHTSEVALQIAHTFSKNFMESHGQLCTAFDTEIENLISRVKEMEDTLNDIVDNTSMLEKEISKTLGEHLSPEQVEQKLRNLDEKLKKDEILIQDKERKLRNLIERSQAMDLAHLVQTYEDDLKDSAAAAVLDTSDARSREAAVLKGLQSRRKQMIDELIKLYSGVNETSKRTQKYLKLISFSADINPDEVVENIDELLKQLEEAYWIGELIVPI